MKKLQRMLMIHWHNYQFELIEFAKINFMTGKTAAGKSTVIDALQLVLLGETGGTFFNKAANKKSNRSLQSYLFGEKGDDGDTGVRYMRDGNFTSYVALEFFDEDKRQAFVAGIVCDCFIDKNFDSKWFVVNKAGLPDNFFVNQRNQVPFTIRELKAQLNKTVGKNGFEFCDTNRRYQQVLLAKFGQLKDRYRSLLKKAVPFSPIADIEKFITESICEVKNPIDIGNMQNNIRQYKTLEHDAYALQKRIEQLHIIEKIYQEYANECEKLRQQEYIIVRAEKEEYVAQIIRLKEAVVNYTTKLADLNEQVVTLDKKLAKISADYNDLHDEYIKSDVNQKEQELTRQITQYKEQINKLQQANAQLCEKLQSYGQDWLRHLSPLRLLPEFADTNLTEVLTLGRRLQGLTQEAMLKVDLPALVIPLKQFADALVTINSNLTIEHQEMLNAIVELEQVIAHLEKGVKPYNQKLLRLKALIETELTRRHQQAIKVDILADLLEICDMRWANALESYLDKQKFYLLIDEKYFIEALKIYNEHKVKEGFSDFGLVDIGKLKKTTIQLQKNSLAEEIEASDAAARLYIDYLLGRVIKCDVVADLRQHHTAITADCMLYKNFVARQIDPRRWANPYIGQESLKIQLRNKQAELVTKQTAAKKLADKVATTGQAKTTQFLEQFEAESSMQIMQGYLAMPKIKAALLACKQEYEGLDLLYLQRLKEKIAELKQQESVKSEELQKVKVEAGINEQQTAQIKGQQLPEAQQAAELVEERIVEKYDAKWRETIGEVRFLAELKQRVSATVLRNNFVNSAVSNTRNKVDKYKSNLEDARSKYNSEYKMPYDIRAKHNDDFAKELVNLDDIQLPQYVDQICDARIKAYNQFRDDFLAKVKANIETVDMQLNELNASIKQSVFGTDSYHFTKTPRKEYKRYYDMIMDPLLMDTGGWNIASESFNEKYKVEIGELFKKLLTDEMNLSAEERAQYENDIKKYTDYKTYLTFDLIVTNQEGEKQRLSKTLMKKMLV